MNSVDYSMADKHDAISAVKDVLYMYKTLVHYGGFFDDFGEEDGRFDPSFYIDCDPIQLGICAEEAKLLHEGSAIKIICGILFSWGQGNHPEEKTYYVTMFENLMLANRLEHIPMLRDAIALSIKSDREFWIASGKLYKEYVLDFFQSMSK